MKILFIFLHFSLSYSLKEDWTIHVHTGAEQFAGTDSSVFIRMFNSISGYTDEYELTHENWLYGSELFPFKDLFEYGGHDRFGISTEKFGYVEKIHVRRDNFPVIRSDWFLDRIIVERNRDSQKFTFVCQCWLRTDQPEVTISVSSSDVSAIDNLKPSTHTHIIAVIILSASVVLITCFICFIHQFCRKQDYRSVYMRHEPPMIGRYCLPSAPPCLYVPITPPETIQRLLLPVNTPVLSTDEPPAYRDLFPD